MPTVAAFYSAQEATKPAGDRVHHTNSTCPSGQDIRQPDRRVGTNGYPLCKECASRNAKHE